MTTPLLSAIDRFLEAARVVSRNDALRPIEHRIEVIMRRHWRLQRQAFLIVFRAYSNLFREATSEDFQDAFVASEGRTSAEAARRLQIEMEAAARAGMTALMVDVGIEIGFDVHHPLIEIGFDVHHPLAVSWMENYGARRIVGIDETTRSYIRTVIRDGLDQGWNYNKVAEMISERYEEFRIGRPQAHIASRAHMVAVTEAGEAYCSGEAVMVKDLVSKGLEMEKHWLVTGGRICSICQNNDGEGWIPAETAFSSGHDHPLAHPACRCATQYRLKREDRRMEAT